MKCEICGRPLCAHGSNRVDWQVWKCIDCGAVGINAPAPIHYLPMYEGKATTATDTFNSVCKKCYDREINNL